MSYQARAGGTTGVTEDDFQKSLDQLEEIAKGTDSDIRKDELLL